MLFWLCQLAASKRNEVCLTCACSDSAIFERFCFIQSLIDNRTKSAWDVKLRKPDPSKLLLSSAMQHERRFFAVRDFEAATRVFLANRPSQKFAGQYDKPESKRVQGPSPQYAAAAAADATATRCRRAQEKTNRAASCQVSKSFNSLT
jgi:hypothetical protein